MLLCLRLSGCPVIRSLCTFLVLLITPRHLPLLTNSSDGVAFRLLPNELRMLSMRFCLCLLREPSLLLYFPSHCCPLTQQPTVLILLLSIFLLMSSG